MSTTLEKINITVPVYKVEEYLDRCVESLLNQTFTNFQLILVDDGSPDACGVMLDEYARRDSRIIVIHQQNGGLSAARNAGIELALKLGDCQWITFVDSDDWVHKDYLKYLYDACKKNNADVAVCGYYETSADKSQADEKAGDSIAVTPEDLWCNYRGKRITEIDEYMVSPTVAWGKLYRMELFKQIRYPFGKLHEDEFITYKILFSLDKIALVQSGLLYYFQNPQSIVGSRWNLKRLDCIEALKGQTDFFRKNRFENAHRYARISLYDNLIYSINQLEYAGYRFKKVKYKFFFKHRLIKDLHYNHPIPAYEKYYSYVFPVLYKPYLFGRSAVNKLKRLFRRKIPDEAKKQ